MHVEASALVDLPLFAGLSTVELEEIVSLLVQKRIAARERLIREGDPPGHPIFILLAGSVEVTKAGVNGRPHVISSLSAPSVFGEIEVLAKRPAIASVTAVTDVEVAELPRGAFDELAAQSRSSVLKIIKNLAQTLSFRLAATDEQLAAQFDTGDSLSRAKIGLMRSVLYSSWKDEASKPR